MLTFKSDEKFTGRQKMHSRGAGCPPLGRSNKVPVHLLTSMPFNNFARFYSSKSTPAQMNKTDSASEEVSVNNLSDLKSSALHKLTHLTQSGDAHMVSISSKQSTKRTAVAVCSIHFSNDVAIPLVRENRAKKGDVLGVARIAGIMAAKKTSDLIPLCHPIAITHVNIDLKISHEDGSIMNSLSSASRASISRSDTERYEGSDWRSPVSETVPHNEFGGVEVKATVSCDGKTGVEMEALTAASTAALTIYDMCKAVDKGMRIEGLRVVRKEGGKVAHG